MGVGGHRREFCGFSRGPAIGGEGCYAAFLMGLHLFNIGDIPVRVSLWYAVLQLYWFRGGESARSSLLWIAIVTVSILVHELGHAVVARYFHLRPSILLHGLGGLCYHDRAVRDRDDAFIVAAGPGAGLLLGGLTWLVATFAPIGLAQSEWFYSVITMSLYVNIGWSLINLLPIWPLDGGKLYRLILLRWFKPAKAEPVTHYTALVLLAFALVYGAKTGSVLLVVMALWAVWDNVMGLRGDRTTDPVRTVNHGAKELLNELKQAYDRQDFKEAARLGHILRREANVAEAVAREGVRLLGLACARTGEHAEALTYLRNEPPTPEVVEARIECLFALGRDAELSELLESEEFRKLTPDRRDEILHVVRAEESV